MIVKQLKNILAGMPEDAIVTIGDDYDTEAQVVTLMSKHMPGANPDKVIIVNIDN